MAGEAEVADLALLDRLEGGVDGAILGEDPVGVIVVAHLVELPEVEMVGLEPSGGCLRDRPCASLAVRPQHLVIRKTLSRSFPSDEGLAHPLLGEAVVVVPGVVEEGDPFMHGLWISFRLWDSSRDGGVGATPAPQADQADHLAGLAQGAERDAALVLLSSRGEAPASPTARARRPRPEELATGGVLGRRHGVLVPLRGEVRSVVVSRS